MATVVLSSNGAKFPVGSTVKAYLRSAQPAVWDYTGAPAGSQIASATVASDGTTTLSSLADDTAYVAYALVGSSNNYVNFRTPAAAAGTGTVSAGSITATEIADALKPSVSAAAGTESLRALGTSSSTAAAGNDSRLSDTRSPTALSVVNASVSTTAAIAQSKLALAITDTEISSTLSPSKITGTAVVTADSRLSDARVPTTQKFTTGRYYGPLGSLTTNLPAEGALVALPFVVGETKTFDRIGVNVTTAGTAGAVIRLGIYADDGHCNPGALVLDAGTVSGTSIAAVEATISQQLTPALYWLVSCVQGAAGTRPTMTAISSSSPSLWPNPGGLTLAAAVGSSNQGGLLSANGAASGALPGTFPAISTTFTAPRPVVRAA